ncbi:hypothetical protein GE09DRAFT_1184154 [Coniochaeta sp. 2T2.1]|nr:hypothetical protein GE09DRAFT_1184154 [Coniochaeta sp. 2T2.1]
MSIVCSSFPFLVPFLFLHSPLVVLPHLSALHTVPTQSSLQVVFLVDSNSLHPRLFIDVDRAQSSHLPRATSSRAPTTHFPHHAFSTRSSILIRLQILLFFIAHFPFVFRGNVLMHSFPVII